MNENQMPEDLKIELDKIIKEQKEKEKQFFESCGFAGLEVTAASFAYKAFLEKENRENPHNFYKSPMARKCFMVGYMIRAIDIK